MKKSRIIIAVIILIAAASFILEMVEVPWLSFLNWGILSAIIAVLICLALLFEFESAATNSKEIALVAMLGTISAVFRVPFAAIPGVQPCTCIIFCAGYVFGPVAGFAVGAITVVVSNFFLGHGPWTLYQIIAWGLIGIAAHLFSRIRLNRVLLIIIGIICGYIYGLITNIWFWTAFIYPLTWNTFLVTELNTIAFDTLHAIGNAIFFGFLALKTIEMLYRFKNRFNIKYRAQTEQIIL
jgi:energy-coupling factor transport system substrate-specific component